MVYKKIKKTLLFTAIIPLITACAPTGYSYMQQRQMQIEKYSSAVKISEENYKKIHEENNKDIIAANNKRIDKITQESNRKLEEIHSKFNDEIKAADILRKKLGVSIGMTTSKVRNETSWGSPDKINRTSTRDGVMEQWVYHSGQYLYFRKNKLYAIQN